MVGNSVQKSRKERRKDARKEHKQNKHQSWMQHMKAEKAWQEQQSKRSSVDCIPKNENSLKNSLTQNSKESVQSERNQSSGKKSFPDKLVVESKPLENKISSSSKVGKGNKVLKRKSKTKFEEFLEMDMKSFDNLAKEDLDLEMKLAKRLKVKDGKLKGTDDGLDMFLADIPSAVGSFDGGKLEAKDVLIQMSEEEESIPAVINSCDDEEESNADPSLLWMSEDEDEYSDKKIKSDLVKSVSEVEGTSSGDERINEDPSDTPSKKRHRRRKKLKKKQESETDVSESADFIESELQLPETPKKEPVVIGSAKYVAPHLRTRAGNESEEHTQIRRRVRGLLNKLSESNVESVTGEITAIFHSVTRNIGTQIVCDEVLAAFSGGPRGNEHICCRRRLFCWDGFWCKFNGFTC